MRKYIISFIACLVIGLAGFSLATVVTNEGLITRLTQKAKNGLQTSPVVLSGHSESITGFLVGSTGTAQVCGIIDATSLAATGQAASTVFEAGAAANSTAYFDFTSRPIQTNNGIIAGCSRSDGTFVVYTEQ